MEQKSDASKSPKRIRLGSLPYLIGIGGTKKSNDMKLMFIEKGTDERYTMRIIQDPANEKLIFDIHTTDQAKKAKAVASGVSPQDAYESIIKMSFDVKQLTRDGAKIEKTLSELAMRYDKELESTDIPENCTIIPLPKNELIERRRSGKEINVDDKKLSEFISSVHSVEDLDRICCERAIIRDDKEVRGVIFKKNRKWHYLDFSAFMREMLNLLRPYIGIEIKGKEAKEEFFEKLNKMGYPLRKDTENA